MNKSKQYVWFKGERKLFSDMSLEEQNNFWKDIDEKANKIRKNVK